MTVPVATAPRRARRADLASARGLLRSAGGNARRGRIFLLTNDADDFFAARGFRVVPRAAVPDPQQASEELRGACPDSATLIRLELSP